MNQLSFSDSEYSGKRKRTRRERFLEEMEQVVPWDRLLALIEPHYPKVGKGLSRPVLCSTRFAKTGVGEPKLHSVHQRLPTTAIDRKQPECDTPMFEDSFNNQGKSNDETLPALDFFYFGAGRRWCACCLAAYDGME